MRTCRGTGGDRWRDSSCTAVASFNLFCSTSRRAEGLSSRAQVIKHASVSVSLRGFEDHLSRGGSQNH